jgi:hypothetical protein
MAEKDAGAPPERVIQPPPEWPRKSGKVRPLNAPAVNALPAETPYPVAVRNQIEIVRLPDWP